MEGRPDLNKTISIRDFTEFYWLKTELVQFCISEGLKTAGAKVEISSRIVQFLKTGESSFCGPRVTTKSISSFDWKNEILSLDTILTDNYRNTENVRKFFLLNIGAHFKFNVKFMNWMKNNSGKNLRQAVTEWNRIKTNAKTNKELKVIAPQFEYNRYVRDFMMDNPQSSRLEGIRLWKIKKLKRGSNEYGKEDLKWIKNG